MQEKICSKCGKAKPKSAFSVQSVGRDGMQAYCKSCRAEDHLQRKYGISAEEKMAMLALQGGGCAICGTKDPSGGRFGEWNVDHNHKTKQTRGLLCNACNLALGYLQDDPNLADIAAAYLRGYSEAF